MKELIYPMLKEDYVSSHLKDEERKREIPILPINTAGMTWRKRIWLKIKKLLNKLWKRKYQ